MKNGKFLAGVIAGMGAGTLLGILFAPAKGSQTRKKIMGKCATNDKAKAGIHDIIRKSKERLQHRTEENDLHGSIN